MAIKKSVRLSDKTENLCQIFWRQDGSENWSGAINAMALRYDILMKECLPDLTEAEKNAYACAYNGRMLNKDIMLEVAAFDFTISEACQFDSQIAYFTGDAEAFYKKSAAYSKAEKLAIIDFTQRYWSNFKEKS